MTPWSQVGVGTVVLGVGLVVHVGFLAAGIEIVTLASQADEHRSGVAQSLLVLLTGAATMTLAHAVQILLWATVLRGLGALHGFANIVYFTLVTNTTLGYGDITLGEQHRLLGAMASVSGLLSFGLSTAFLVGLVGGLLAAPA